MSKYSEDLVICETDDYNRTVSHKQENISDIITDIDNLNRDLDILRLIRDENSSRFYGAAREIFISSIREMRRKSILEIKSRLNSVLNAALKENGGII